MCERSGAWFRLYYQPGWHHNPRQPQTANILHTYTHTFEGILWLTSLSFEGKSHFDSWRGGTSVGKRRAGGREGLDTLTQHAYQTTHSTEHNGTRLEHDYLGTLPWVCPANTSWDRKPIKRLCDNISRFGLHREREGECYTPSRACMRLSMYWKGEICTIELWAHYTQWHTSQLQIESLHNPAIQLRRQCSMELAWDQTQPPFPTQLIWSNEKRNTWDAHCYRSTYTYYHSRENSVKTRDHIIGYRSTIKNMYMYKLIDKK